MQERLAVAEVRIVEQLRPGIDRDSGSTLCEARHVESAGTVGGRFWVGGSGAEDGRASLQTDRSAMKALQCGGMLKETEAFFNAVK